MNPFKIRRLLAVGIFSSALILSGCNGHLKSSAEKMADTSTSMKQKAAKIDKAAMARKVKAAFLHAWDGYKKYAWGHDELKPLSKTYYDWYGSSLYMTPVEAFGTMELMGLKKQAAQDEKLILNHLSFNKNVYVSNFEITIRMLGGLLSAYELTGNKRFLALAKDLGNRLLPAYNTPTGMPYEYTNLKTGKTRGVVNSTAEIGTSIVEMGTLSKLTHNPIYFNKSKRALVALYNHRSKIGLVGTTINVKTGKWVNTQSHISGQIDSYYEYLLKGALLFHDKDLMHMWKNSVRAVNKYLADSVSTGYWYAHVNMNTGKIEATQFGALDAYFPAVLALGGELKRAEALDTSCFKMWELYGIEPEQINFVTMKPIDKQYYLRPENLESAYYLYHYTHNPVYLERAKTMFDSIIKYCRTPDGFANLSNVETKKKADQMPSYLFAEVFKYAYLIFSPPSTLDFDHVIFNTEAHPMKDAYGHN